MDAFVLLACPACSFSDPVFIVLSMFAGTVPISYLLLRPYTRKIRPWGVPHVSIARLVSLATLLAGLVPLWFLGRQEHSTTHVTICLAGLAACCVYLWFRSCWLLDSHHIRSPHRELMFPGLLAPAILLLGTVAGSWVLGILLVAPAWPMILIPHTIWSAVMGMPIALLVLIGLNHTFQKPQVLSSSHKGDAAASAIPVVAEPSDEGESE